MESYNEEEPIGKIAYGDLEIPGTYIIKEDEGVFKIKIRSETFSTVNIRKFFNNVDSKGRRWVDYNRPKDEIVFVLDDEDGYIIEVADLDY